MSTQAGLGQAALQNRDYPVAIKHLTDALKSSQSPLWLIQRSTAYQRLGEHTLALTDANNAVLAAINRARREQIAAAQFRRGVALYGLKRYGDARMCFNWCRKANEKEPGLGMWQAKVKADYEKLGEEAEENKITITEIPDKVEDVKQAEQVATEPPATNPASDLFSAVAPTPLAPIQTPKEKIRHEWFQSSSKVTITIFAKGVPKDQAEVIFEPGTLEVRFPIVSSGSTYDFTLSPLFSKVDPSSCTYSITPHKIEIKLHKSTSGLKWSALEGTKPISDDKENKAPASATNPMEATASPPDKAPAYPTSSRKGAKDWDSVAANALTVEPINGEPGKPHEDDDEDGDPLQGFFRKLYQSSDPDTRRAMMKSYTESNGTALSTNWADVEKGPVETKPPEGVEAKKWGT